MLYKRYIMVTVISMVWRSTHTVGAPGTDMVTNFSFQPHLRSFRCGPRELADESLFRLKGDASYDAILRRSTVGNCCGMAKDLVSMMRRRWEQCWSTLIWALIINESYGTFSTMIWSEARGMRVLRVTVLKVNTMRNLVQIPS